MFNYAEKDLKEQTPNCGCFVHAQMALFHETIHEIEGNTITAVDGCLILKDGEKKRWSLYQS